MIPLLDLNRQHAAIKVELDCAVAEVVDSCRFIGGPAVKSFAEAFAAYCGVGHAIPCSNGTEALRLAILGVLGEGDRNGEIITVSHTFAATVEAIVAAGYKPVFVDIDPATYLMDPEQVELACTSRTVAVLPVHLYGQMVDMRRLRAMADDRGIALIEDAAQAHGASFDGVGPGQLGDAASFSFFPGKNLGAWGDAGAVVCNDEGVAKRISRLVDHGRSGKFTHSELGTNARMDAIHAAVLGVKLRHLNDWNAARRRVAGRYDELFSENARSCAASEPRVSTRADVGIREPSTGPDDAVFQTNAINPPAVTAGAEHVYHQYVVQVSDRDAVRESMREAGIATGVHYLIPMHEQPACKYLGVMPEALPVTHEICSRILSLPMDPGLSPSDVEKIARGLVSACKPEPSTRKTEPVPTC